MKKLIAVLTSVCLVMAGALTWLSSKPGSDNLPAVLPSEAPADPVETDAPGETDAPAAEEGTEEAAPIRTLDYDAMYLSRQPDEVVMTVGGEDVTWAEYFYWLQYYGGQAEYYMSMFNAYGMPTDWDSELGSEGETYLSFVSSSAVNTLRESASLELLCRENGIQLTEDDLKDMQDTLAADIAATCGENGTEEDFDEYLQTLYMNRAIYDRMVRINYLYPAAAVKLYGENGRLISDEEAAAYLADNGYLCSTHILFLTTDMSTGEAMDEAAVAEKKAQADALVAELRAIEDPAERVARFKELKELYCEDGGKVSYPDGYLYPANTMYPIFEETTAAQGEYEVSDPVLSQAGYHIIMTLPLDPDMVIFSSDGSSNTARTLLAAQKFNAVMDEYIEKCEVVMAPGFESFDVGQFLVG